MKFEDLSMTLEQVVDFVKNHNMFIGDDDHKHLSNDGILEYLKANRDRITFKPLYYYGDTIIGIQIVQSPNQKIPDRKTKCVIKTHINIKQNVIFGAKLKPV